jgi:hypothetical protein
VIPVPHRRVWLREPALDAAYAATLVASIARVGANAHLVHLVRELGGGHESGWW